MANNTDTTQSGPLPSGPIPTRQPAPMSPFVGILVDHALPLLLCLGLIGLGSYWAQQSGKEIAADVFQAAGALGFIVVLAITPVTWQLRRRATQNAVMIRKIEHLGDAIRHLGDHAMVSDDARRVLNRGAERNMLCKAIEEDIHAQAWDAALVLCDELAQRFGYRQDAEEFRARIELARSEIQERKVADAIARLDGLIVQRRWDVAANEARRIQRLFPDSTRTERLRDRVEQARGVYKSGPGAAASWMPPSMARSRKPWPTSRSSTPISPSRKPSRFAKSPAA